MTNDSTEALEAEVRRLREALAQAEGERDAYRQALDGSPALIATLRGPQHVFRFANDRYMQAVGQRPLLNKPIREALPELEGQGIYERLDGVYQTRETREGSELLVRLERQEGRGLDDRYFDFGYAYLPATPTQEAGVLVHGVDVTHRVVGQRQLQADRDRFWNLSLDLMDVASVSTGHVVRANPAWTHVLGWSEEEVKAAPLFEFIHPDDRAGVAQVLGKLGEGVNLFDFECRMKAKDGRYRAFEWVAQAEGDLAYCYGRDVTDKRRTERTLRRATDILPLALALLDDRFVYHWMNPALGEIFDRRPDEVVGHSVQEIFPEAWPVVHGLLQQVFDTRQPYVTSALPLVVRQHGKLVTRDYDLTYQPILDPDGRVESILTLAQDVTERVEETRRQHERIASLQELDEAKDQFLGILSHELRTPINAIMGFGSILEDEVAGTLTDSQHHYVGRILSASDVLLGLVSDLLDMTRIRAGKFSVERQPAALAPLVADALAPLAAGAAAKGITLDNAVCEELPLVSADARRVVQILDNLVGNAIKFTPAGGHVALRAHAGPTEMTIEVEDDGPGIPPEDLPTIFEPFTQVDMSATRTKGGLGLGLAIARNLVEAHGGRIDASSGEGGTRLWFTLPLAGASTPEA